MSKRRWTWLLGSWVLWLGVARIAWSSEVKHYRALARDLKFKLSTGQLALESLSPLTIVAVPDGGRSSVDHRASLIADALRGQVAGLQVVICDRCLRGEVLRNADRLVMQLPPASGLAVRPNSTHKAGMWVSQQGGVVSYRVASLETGVVLASATLVGGESLTFRSESHYTKASNLRRLAQGQPIFHSYADLGLYPGQHVSFNFVEQWGEDGAYQTGVGLSLAAPIGGVGAVMYKAMPSLSNALVGIKVLVSIPAALARAASSSESGGLDDPLITFVGSIRIPIPQESGRFGLLAFFSHTGKVGIGVSF